MKAGDIVRRNIFSRRNLTVRRVKSFPKISHPKLLTALFVMILLTSVIYAYTVLKTTQNSSRNNVYGGTTSQNQVNCAASVLQIKTIIQNAGASNTNLTITVGYDSGTIVLVNPIVEMGCGVVSQINSSAYGTTYTVFTGSVFIMNPLLIPCTTSNPVDYVRVSATCTGPQSKANYTVSAKCEKDTGCGL